MTAMTLNVRLRGPLAEHVGHKVGPDGHYENVSEYVRDLIRRELEREKDDAFVALRDELQRRFATPDDEFVQVSAADVIARNRLRRQG